MTFISCTLYVYLCLLGTAIHCMESNGKKISLKKTQAKSDTELTRKPTIRARKNSSPEQLSKEKHQEIKDRLKSELSSSSELSITSVGEGIVKVVTLNKINRKKSEEYWLDMRTMPSPKESTHPDYLAHKKSFEEKYKKPRSQ